MVLVNTKNSRIPQVEFKHLVEVPRCDCIFGSAKDSEGRTQLFLIFNHRGRIYRRNGLKSTWIELTSEAEYTYIRELIADAIRNRKVPIYTTRSPQGILN